MLAFLTALIVVNDPTLVVYEETTPHAHIGDILRYGQEVSIEKEEGDFAYISYPPQHGWVNKNGLIEVEEVKTNAYVSIHGAYLHQELDTEWGPIFSLPFESPLEVIEEPEKQHRRFLRVRLIDGTEGYVQRNLVTFDRKILTLSETIQLASFFINLKYLWGGTSSFGYDCSGFVQMLYRQMGIDLPRNSSQQANDPRFQEVTQAKAGDLIFFKNKSGKVGHVGFVINEREFIHAFPLWESYVCISSLSDERFQNGYYYFGSFVKRKVANGSP